MEDVASLNRKQRRILKPKLLKRYREETRYWRAVYTGLVPRWLCDKLAVDGRKKGPLTPLKPRVHASSVAGKQEREYLIGVKDD